MKYDIGYQGVMREVGIQILRLLVGLAIAASAFAFGFMAVEFGAYFETTREMPFLFITLLMMCCFLGVIAAGFAIDDSLRAEL